MHGYLALPEPTEKRGPNTGVPPPTMRMLGAVGVMTPGDDGAGDLLPPPSPTPMPTAAAAATPAMMPMVAPLMPPAAAAATATLA